MILWNLNLKLMKKRSPQLLQKLLNFEKKYYLNFTFKIKIEEIYKKVI